MLITLVVPATLVACATIAYSYFAHSATRLRRKDRGFAAHGEPKRDTTRPATPAGDELVAEVAAKDVSPTDLRVEVEIAKWAGPWPSEAALHSLQRASPDTYRRLFDQFERDAHHRRNRERRADHAASVGFITAAVCDAALLALAAYALHSGYPTQAAALGISTLTALPLAYFASAKLANRSSRRRQPFRDDDGYRP